MNKWQYGSCLRVSIVYCLILFVDEGEVETSEEVLPAVGMDADQVSNAGDIDLPTGDGEQVRQ